MTEEIKTPSLSADEIYSLARGGRILDDKWREPTKWEIYLARQIETVTQERDALRKKLDEVYQLLEDLSISEAYMGERTGGILKGCPRAPNPTPNQMATKVRIALRTLKGDQT